MARSGSFGTSVNPFGTGTFGGLAQYDIGENVKDLTAYSLEVAWGNGTINDAQYQASLASLAAASAAGTMNAIETQNKLDDVNYRIGRSVAEAAGLDALIAFDQQTLAGMDPNNLRYRSIYDSLNTEMANRRSRDYGVVVDAYNRGETSTESLLAWVENTRASLPADAPDADNWTSVHTSLVERVVSEKDAQVYQDYQDRKMLPADFLAYLTGRRDAYSPDSPKWDEANRRLQDAQKNVKDTALAVRDQDVFNRYAEGKISDKTYLVYINKRIAAMDPTDPALSEWKHKLTIAAHSLAEDDLRHKVATATTAAADAAARKNLRDFYVAYSKTLNPGSAEYRQTEEQILSLKPKVVTGGGGGGKGTGAGTGAGKGAVVKGGPEVPKIIPTTGSFDHALTLLTPNAGAPKKDQAIAVEVLALNLANAKNAKNDKVWLYQDPRYPGQMVAERDANGVLVKRDAKGNLDPKGKQQYVPGSSYRLTSSDEIAAMQVATANYSYGLAAIALRGGVVGGKVVKGGNVKAFWDAIDDANDAMDSARTTQAHAFQANITVELKAIDQSIESATKLNDNALVVNLLFAKRDIMRGARTDSSLDLEQKKAWDEKIVDLENDPRFPTVQTDFDGEEVLGPGGFKIQNGGAINMVASPKNPDGSLVLGQAVLNEGWHFVLDDNKGKAAAGLVNEYDMGIAPGEWGANFVTVQSGIYGVRRTGDVRVQQASSVLMKVTFKDGTSELVPFGKNADWITYKDEYGNRVSGYSVDGRQSWIMVPDGIYPTPILELEGRLTKKVKPDGSYTISDDQGQVWYTRSASGADGSPGAWGVGEGFAALSAAAGSVGAIAWFGQIAAQNNGDISAGVGAPGQYFRLVRDEGAGLNLVPREILYAEATASQVIDTARRTVARGSAAGATLAEESAAVRARGLIPPPVPLTGSDYVRQKRADAAAVAERATAATARLRLGDTLADEVNDIEARKSPGAEWRAVGAVATALSAAAAPGLSGIVALGSAIVNAVSPPHELPQQYVPPSSLTPPQQYVPPSSLYAPIPTPTLRPPPVPVYAGPLGRTPAPKPAPKPVPVYTGPLGRTPAPKTAPKTAPVTVYTGPLGR